MNDEIKKLIRDCNELLNDKFFTLNNIEITRHELNLLLDYINNLQQENERLKEWKKDLLNENIELENIRKEAVEYIENDNNFWVALGEDCGKPNDDLDKLLNILNGRSDE